MRNLCVVKVGILCLCVLLDTPDAAWAFQVIAASSTATAKSPAVDLHRIFDEEWQRTLKENPTQASQLGDRRYNKLWPDTSLTAIRASQKKTQQVLAAIRALDRSTLSAADRLNARLFEYQYEADVSEQRFQLHLLPINQRGGIQDKDTTVIASIPICQNCS